MITFFSILLVLFGINVLLLLFSLKGVSGNSKKNIQSISTNAVPRLHPEQYSKTAYKKAV